jgi:hypothetical protein
MMTRKQEHEIRPSYPQLRTRESDEVAMDSFLH